MLFGFKRKKVTITKNEFVEVVTHCLSKPLSKESIAQTAKSIDFNIDSEANFTKLYQELLVLNMWIIVRTCEKLFNDVHKRNACLDLFHHNIYEMHNVDVTDDGFRQWMVGVGLKYVEYSETVEKKYEPGSMWWLAKLVNRNIFGEVKKDPFVQADIGHSISSFTVYVERLVGEVLKRSQID